MRFRKLMAGAGLVLCVAMPAPAAAQVLTFEGLQDLEDILDFYNGGTGSLGSSGTNYGISFMAGALSVIDADDGGTGNIEYSPSGITAAFFLTVDEIFMNVLAGFSTGFSFFYSSSQLASVSVWSGLNGTGSQLASLPLLAQFNDGCPPYEPGRSGAWCNWTPVGVLFDGTAMSVSFGGAANLVAFDDITLSSEVPGVPPDTVVPEPGTVVLLATGLLGLGAANLRRRRRAWVSRR